MGTIATYFVIAALLFGVAFATKRRFGLLGLALSAGSLLSGIWGYNAGLIASSLRIPSNPLTSAVITSLIVLLPSAILLFHGHTYKTLAGRITGAALFSILAITFLIDPLSHILVPQGVGVDIYNNILNNRDMVIGVGLIVAVIDLFLTKSSQSSDKKSKH